MIKRALKDIIILCVKTRKGGILIQNKIKTFSSEDPIYFKLEMAPKASLNTCISLKKRRT